MNMAALRGRNLETGMDRECVRDREREGGGEVGRRRERNNCTVDSQPTNEHGSYTIFVHIIIHMLRRQCATSKSSQNLITRCREL